ncbi:MAG: hypothetical protein EZS28_048237, partial [Streblomastix strix]
MQAHNYQLSPELQPEQGEAHD